MHYARYAQERGCCNSIRYVVLPYVEHSYYATSVSRGHESLADATYDCALSRDVICTSSSRFLRHLHSFRNSPRVSLDLWIVYVRFVVTTTWMETAALRNFKRCQLCDYRNPRCIVLPRGTTENLALGWTVSRLYLLRRRRSKNGKNIEKTMERSRVRCCTLKLFSCESNWIAEGSL